MAKKVSKTKSTKKSTTVKKVTKVEEPEVEKVTKVEEPEVKKKETKKGLNNKIIGVLYAFCSIAWIVSGYLNFNNNTSTDSNTLAYLDIFLGITWMVLAVLYFIRDKKNK